MTVNYSPTRGVVTTNPLSNDAEVFPILLGEDFRAAKTPTFSTGVKIAASGREVRNSYWSAPRYAFKITYEFLRNIAGWEELEALLSFFNSREGRYGFFFYWDSEDPQVLNQAFGTGDGATTLFQLLKSRGVGMASATTEPCYAVWNPAGGASGITPFSISINGTPTTAFTVGPWGQVTFTSAPASGAVLTWSGCPLYVCRFDEDEMELVQLASLLWAQNKGLTFLSLKP